MRDKLCSHWPLFSHAEDRHRTLGKDNSFCESAGGTINPVSSRIYVFTTRPSFDKRVEKYLTPYPNANTLMPNCNPDRLGKTRTKAKMSICVHYQHVCRSWANLYHGIHCCRCQQREISAGVYDPELRHITSNSYRGGTQSAVCAGENGQCCITCPWLPVLTKTLQSRTHVLGTNRLELEGAHFCCSERSRVYFTEGVRKNAFHAPDAGDLKG